MVAGNSIILNSPIPLDKAHFEIKALLNMKNNINKIWLQSDKAILVIKCLIGC